MRNDMHDAPAFTKAHKAHSSLWFHLASKGNKKSRRRRANWFRRQTDAVRDALYTLQNPIRIPN
jgi:hypothetical protein